MKGNTNIRKDKLKQYTVRNYRSWWKQKLKTLTFWSIDENKITKIIYQKTTNLWYSLQAFWMILAALSWRFQILVDETISNSFLVGNCFLNLTSICSCSSLKLSVSSTWPKTCFTNACRISKQWILLPLEMGKLKDTKATVFGFEMPSGGSKDAMKSDSCEKWINCAAWGSYLKLKF